jgi:hypothetical protein
MWLSAIRVSGRITRGSLTMVAVALLLAVPALAQDVYWDQVNDGFTPMSFLGIWYCDPIGQEFTPSLDHVDVVELYICGVYAGELEVRVHVDTIYGDVIGSATTPVGGGCFSEVMFVFEDGVQLVPGDRYVIEVRASDGQFCVCVNHEPPAPYLGGVLILMGEPAPDLDAWFREGVWLAYAADELGCHVDCTGRCRARRTRRASLDARG